MRQAAEIAKTVRNAAKAAQKTGALDLPVNAKIRVTSDYFAGGCSVDIKVDNISRDWAFTNRPDGYGGTDIVASDAARKVGKQLAVILAKHTQGRTWGDVTVGGANVDGVRPASWRPGQD